MTSWLEELNPAQREAVTAPGGPVLVIAGAGTGKTKTLASRVAWLIERGVPPDRILLLTFTRRAAAEMIGRAARLCGKDASGKVWGGTFHAVSNRLLRVYGTAIGLPPDFTVMDEDDASDLMGLLRAELGLVGRERRFPSRDTLVRIYSHTVNAQRSLQETLERYFPWCLEDREEIAAVFQEYVARKMRQFLLDYDDLLLYWRALCVAPRVGERAADRFEHVLVDEYQDTNTLQSDILRGMRKKYDNVMVVGDDAQSIYGFRAATIRNILDFPSQFPGTRQIMLEQNYRSTQPILAAANAVMEQARERYTKELWSRRESTQRPVLITCQDEAHQTELVYRQILEHLEQGIPLMKQAVLFRAAHHSADLEIALTRRNIPYHKFGGLKFIEAAHIKDALAVLRILENPFDEISWFRVLRLMRGVGPKIARRIMDGLGVLGRGALPPAQATDASIAVLPAEPSSGAIAAADRSDREPASTRAIAPLRRLLDAPPVVPESAREEFASLRQTISDCLAAAPPGWTEDSGDGAAPSRKRQNVAAQIERIARFLEPLLARAYDNAAMRMRDIEQLARIAERYRSRARFVVDLTLDPPRATSDLAGAPHLDEDWLTLSTIHSAKGCEWSAVYVLHVADGMIPSDMALRDEEGVEEERRLLYVAMTRAKDHLYLYFPFRYYHQRFGLSDGHGYAQLSRYLADIPRDRLEVRSAGAAAFPDARPGGASDIRAQLGRLWQGPE
ncbi:MAG: ATP-dependent helicase [Phycisphaerae bacterium]|nr:ATP-dependent helicase [Phycisphaerae bacterium]